MEGLVVSDAMRLKFLQCLVAVVEAGSASGAAQALGVGQPSVTRQLQALERIVGEPLFERAKRPWRLTPAGERTLRVARATLRTVDSVSAGFETLVHGPASDALQIGLAQTASMLLGFPLARAALRHHDVDQQVEFQSADSQALLEHLLDGVLDLAWVDASVLGRYPGLGVGPMYSFPIQIWVRTGHLLLDGRAPIALKEMFQFPMVAPYPPSDADTILRQVLPDGAGVTDSLTLISEDVPALARLTAETDAVLITIAPLVAEWVRAGALHTVPLDYPLAFASRIQLAVTPHRALSAAVLGWVQACVHDTLLAAGASTLIDDGADRLVVGGLD
jgi:DNA-binding transcriptional LysR family regulator